MEKCRKTNQNKKRVGEDCSSFSLFDNYPSSAEWDMIYFIICLMQEGFMANSSMFK